MIHIIYVCAATSEPSEQELVDLLEEARSRNLAQNITGMLLYDCETYMQVLEGPRKDVHEVYASIQRDDRANRIVTLIEEEISERNFPDWSMGFKDLVGCDPEELPGYSDVFNGKLNPEIATENCALAINLLMSFANDAGPKRSEQTG